MEGEQVQTKPWFREIQVVWIAVLVWAIYLPRMTGLNLSGEETRRAQVAREMLWTGDWLVPRQQGEIYLSRPPLGSWAIALAGTWRGEVDAVAARFPTILAVLLTSLLLYGYARNFLSQTGAFLAALAYPTMAQVMQLGRTAETEGLFTLFLSASLMVWHWGYLKKWPAWVTWSAGYFLAALAGLTKGPQGIAYFVGPVWAYLLLIERNWRMFLKPSHALGLLIGTLTIAAWQVPYTLATSLAAGKAVWINQAANRYSFWDPKIAAMHYLRFPLEILACTFPCSLAFIQLPNRACWRSMKPIWPEVQFLLIALAVTFPTVWFAPYARGRYFMPMYPLLGVYCAVVLERAATAKPPGWLYNGWRQYVLGLSAAAVVGGIVVLGIALDPDLVPGEIEISTAAAVGFLIAALGYAYWTFLTFRSDRGRELQITTAGLAAVLGFAYAGVILSAQTARQPVVSDLLAEVDAEVPEDTELVSFGSVPHAFAYYYGEYIPQRAWPESADDPAPPAYFCFATTQLPQHALPFAWEKIAELSFEDGDEPSPGSYVVVARRIPAVASTPKSGPN